MALNFSADTHRAAVPPSTLFTGGTQLTVFARVRSSSLAADRYFWGQTAGATFRLLGVRTTGSIYTELDNTVDAVSQSSASLIAANTWYDIAMTWDAGVSAPRFYYSALGGQMAETGYSSQTTGSGTPPDNSAIPMVWGNYTDASDSANWRGDVAFGAFYKRILSLHELTQLQKGFFVANPGVHMNLGLHSTECVDTSNAVHRAAVTGAAYTPHPLILLPHLVVPKPYLLAHTAAAQSSARSWGYVLG